MKHEIVSVPRCNVVFTKEEVAKLALYSSTHYDHACRQLSKLGGMIHNWETCLKLMLIENEVTATLTFRDLDMLCKVMECRAISDSKGAELSWHLNVAIRQMGAQ